MAQAQHSDADVAEATKKPKRIDVHYVSHEIQHLFHVEKGFLFTVKELLLRPGKAIREFLFEDRSKLVKPVIFVIFIAVIFTVTMKVMGVKYSLLNIDRINRPELKTKEIGNWVRGNLGYTTLVMSVFIALCTKLIFRKRDFTTFEILVAICYVTGTALLLLGSVMVSTQLVFWVLKQSFGEVSSPPVFVIFIVGAFVISGYFLYPIWAIGQFFGEKNVLNYVKAAISYVLGILSYQTALILLAWVLKQVMP
jgi:hypothetical protein